MEHYLSSNSLSIVSRLPLLYTRQARVLPNKSRTRQGSRKYDLAPYVLEALSAFVASAPMDLTLYPVISHFSGLLFYYRAS